MNTPCPLNYLHWAKTRSHGTFDLAISGLHSTWGDLGIDPISVTLSGPNDEGYQNLVEAIAAQYGYQTSQVATGSGASGANYLVFASLVQSGDDVLVEQPGYGPLYAVPQKLGARVNFLPRRWENRYTIDLADVRSKLTRNTKLLVITNPHNPSGALLDLEFFRQLGEMAIKHGILVLVDEVYLDAIPEKHPNRPPPVATLGHPFISTNSLTKSYGLGGLRCGWVAGPENIVKACWRMHDHVDGVQCFPGEYLSWQAFQRLSQLRQRAQTLLAANRALVTEWMQGQSTLELACPPISTIVFPRFKFRYDAWEFAQRLLKEEQTSVVPGQFFDAADHFRLGFSGQTESVKLGLAAISKLLTKIS